MKALVIASVLFFSLRAMSSEEGENKKSDCIYADQSNRDTKIVAPVETEISKDGSTSVGK